MEETIKKLRVLFAVIFVQFLSLAAIVYYLKKAEIVQDFIDISSKLTVIIPVLMIASILIAYFIYDRIAKSSQQIEDEELQLKKFFQASIIKIAMLDFVGVLVAVMLFILYQQTYLYMLAIIIVFFLLNFPSEMKFKKDFVNRKNVFFDK